MWELLPWSVVRPNPAWDRHVSDGSGCRRVTHDDVASCFPSWKCAPPTKSPIPTARRKVVQSGTRMSHGAVSAGDSGPHIRRPRWHLPPRVKFPGPRTGGAVKTVAHPGGMCRDSCKKTEINENRPYEVGF